MGWFESQGVQGFRPQQQAPAAGFSQGMGDFGDDPFGYSGGSLLTPWTQQFQAPAGSGGGYSAPSYQPFKFDDFGYNFRAPGAYEGQRDLADPGQFNYGDFAGAPAFKPPTAQELQSDPSYQFRLAQGQQALENSAASKGMLHSGNTAKALQDYGQGAASQEYQAAYGRKAQEHDRLQAEAQTGYTTNRGNRAENFDRNAKNAQIVNAQNNASRQAAYSASADTALRGGELGYNIATGTYDRNLALHRQAYDDEQSARNAAASAGSANANQAYNRALDEYKMNYDIFQTNQGNQYNRLMGVTNVGMQAAGAQAGAAGNYGNNMSELYTGRAGVNAAGQLARGNAWGNAFNDIGNAAGSAYMSTRAQPAGGIEGFQYSPRRR